VAYLLWFTAALSIGAMVGWMADIALLHTMPGTDLSIKFTIAICCLLTSISLSPPVHQTNRFKKWIAPHMGVIRNAAAISTLSIIGEISLALWIGYPSFWVELFPFNDLGFHTVHPNQPSTMSLVALFFLSIRGLRFKLEWDLFYAIIPVLLISSLSFVGHLIISPSLFFASATSTGMAAYATLLFFLISTSIFIEKNLPLKR